jgi:hypothetical protein
MRLLITIVLWIAGTAAVIWFSWSRQSRRKRLMDSVRATLGAQEAPQ